MNCKGDFSVMDKLLTTIKQQDSRHLYMTTTFTFEPGHGSWPEPNDDFWVTCSGLETAGYADKEFSTISLQVSIKTSPVL